MTALFDTFSKTERTTMWRQVDIPGVRMRLTKAEKISVLLNMGNADNMQAMVDSGQLTEQEISAVLAASTKKEMDFVQGVWDYLSEFFPEIKDTVARRYNREVTQVEAVPLETPHGSYGGGYFPLKYDNQQGITEGKRLSKTLRTISCLAASLAGIHAMATLRTVRAPGAVLSSSTRLLSITM